MTYEEEKLYKERLRSKNLRIIEEIAEQNSSGHGAKPFKKEEIGFFKTIINILDNQPDIISAGRNTILMKYMFRNGSMLSFEVSRSKIERTYCKKCSIPVVDTELYLFGMTEDRSEDIIMFFKERLNKEIYTFLKRDSNYPICHFTSA